MTYEDFNSAIYTGTTMTILVEWDDDVIGHGTHVTGIIAAADNNLGLVGVAPDVKIHSVKVFDEFGYIYSSSLIDAAYSCRDAGASVISMSLGGPENLLEERNIFADLYAQNNILSITSFGNSGYDDYSYLTAYPDVLSVGAIDRKESVAVFSTFNDMVDLVWMYGAHLQ